MCVCVFQSPTSVQLSILCWTTQSIDINPWESSTSTPLCSASGPSKAFWSKVKQQLGPSVGPGRGEQKPRPMATHFRIILALPLTTKKAGRVSIAGVTLNVHTGMYRALKIHHAFLWAQWPENKPIHSDSRRGAPMRRVSVWRSRKQTLSIYWKLK